MEILVDMHLSGEITAAPTLRPLIQDMTVTHPGGLYGVGMDHNATTQIYWAHGRLAAKRTGTCICPDPNAWVYAFMPLAGCSECMRRTEGGMLPEVLVSRTVEAVGFHFQAWKKKKTWKDCKNKSEGGLQDNCAGWMPDCMEKPGFHFGVRGFSCWGNPPAAAPRTKADEDQSRNLEMQKRRQEFAARQQQADHRCSGATASTGSARTSAHFLWSRCCKRRTPSWRRGSSRSGCRARTRGRRVPPRPPCSAGRSGYSGPTRREWLARRDGRSKPSWTAMHGIGDTACQLGQKEP